MSGSDDEFDDLFSFSTAAPSTKPDSNAAAPTSSSPINFDLGDEDDEGGTVNVNALALDAEDKGSNEAIGIDGDVDAPVVSSSAHTSDTGSYYKVSPPTSATTVNDTDDQDDVDAIFDLGAVKSSAMELKDDDFHAMDADTREFLDFLDKEPEKKNDINLRAKATEGFSDDDEDDGDDGMMDFVDINTDANIQSNKGTAVVVDTQEEDTLPLPPVSSPKTKGTIHEPTLLEDMDRAEMLQKNEIAEAEKEKEREQSDKDEVKDVSTHGNAPTIVSVLPASPKSDTSKSQELPPKSPMRFISRVHPFSKPKGPIRMSSVPKLPKDERSPMTRSTSASARVPVSPTKTQTSSTAAAGQQQNDSILLSTDSMDIDQSDVDGDDSAKSESSEKTDINETNKTEEGQASDAGESVIPVPEEKEIVFSSLSEAIHSPESTMKHIRTHFYTNSNPMEIASIPDDERPWLWSKAICGNKTLDTVESSSLADSFITWDEAFDMDALINGDKTYELLDDFRTKLLREVELLAANLIASDAGTNDVALAKRDLCSLLIFYYRSTYISRGNNGLSADSFDDGGGEDLQFEEEVEENVKMIPDESDTGEGNATGEENKSDGKTSEAEETNENTESESEEPKSEPEDDSESNLKVKDTESTKTHAALKGIKPKGQFVEWNALVGPVAVTLLSSGMSTPVVSVMISRIVPTHMPLVPLTKMERLHAVKTLHQKLYFLICYHLPLLVLHLDKYIPGWYWPKSFANSEGEDGTEENDDDDSATKRSRNLDAQGTIPMTWFTSLLAGEDSSSPIPSNRLLPLWDILLTTEDLSIKFFLALSVLERNSDSLLMLKGQELIDELTAVMSLEHNDDLTIESFVGSDGASKNASLTKSQRHVLTWCNHAQSLRESTPQTVIDQLKVAEDKALNFALNLRSKLSMEKMKARLEAEAEAHRLAVEEANARKLEERMHKYYKEKLEKFYKRHCPEKLGSVDKMLDVYKGRYAVLDNKLIFKYGRGFLPLISVFNPQVTSKTNKIISNVGQGIENKKKNIILARAEDRAKMLEEEMKLDGTERKHQVAVKVDAKEILPVVCANKTEQSFTREPLKYYLVDSRPEETSKFQGAFPTAARLSPDDLMDPDRIPEKVEMFESLRGGAHIVIMGEGFSALPSLYGHQLSKKEEKLLDNDESRTNMCALFFIKKGFPFVSVLDGGFAAAHAWLARDCDHLTLNEVLVDYDEETSLFADLHASYEDQKEFSNASTRRKTTIAMQRLIDNSLVRLTKAEAQLEGFTDRVVTARKEAKEKSTREKNMKSKSQEDDNDKTEASSTATSNDSNSFKNAFAGIRNKIPQKEKSDTDEEAATPNDPKSFKNAFAGIRNKIPQKEKLDADTEEAPKAFDFGKISFGLKNNALTKKKKNEDDELEKEIEASLTPATDDKSSSPKSKPKPPASPMRKIRFGGRNTAASNEDKKDGGPLAFKNALGMSFRKFNTMKPKKPKSETSVSSALREEESIFFD